MNTMAVAYISTVKIHQTTRPIRSRFISVQVRSRKRSTPLRPPCDLFTAGLSAVRSRSSLSFDRGSCRGWLSFRKVS